MGASGSNRALASGLRFISLSAEQEGAGERESEGNPLVSRSPALPLPRSSAMFRFSRSRRVTLGAAAVPGRLWPVRQDSSGRRHAGELSSTPQPSFPAYGLSSSFL